MLKRISLASILLMSWITIGCQEETINPAADTTPSKDAELKWTQDKDLPDVRITPEQDVLFISTPVEVIDKMLEMAQVKKDDLVYDLGCGDGRILIAAAKKHGCRAIGYEIDPELVKKARENVRKNKLQHLVTIEHKDIFEVDFTPADVITMYLTADLNVKLIPQLKKLRPGSRIVSHDFDMKGIKPDEVAFVTSKIPDFVNEHLVYLWTAPLKKE